MDLPIDFNVVLSEKDYQLFAQFIYDQCGIDLGTNKKELVKARLMKRLRILKLKSYKEYYDYVRNDSSGAELVELLDSVSTNVTQFFREKQHFDILRTQVLPALVQKKSQQNNRVLRVWSCAASTGEEIYTLLMTILESIPSAPAWDIRVLGTDISSRVLAAAKQGIYAEEKMRDVPPPLRDKYFSEMERQGSVYYEAKEILKSRAFFARLNLMDEVFPFKKRFDFIFCRNVMIYFDKPTQETLTQKLYTFLDKGGYLFIGHSESLIGLKTEFKPALGAAVFQKPL